MNHEERPVTFPEEGVQFVYPANLNERFRYLAFHKIHREAKKKKNFNSRKEMLKEMFCITWRDGQRASWIREQTKINILLTTDKNKNGLGQIIV